MKKVPSGNEPTKLIDTRIWRASIARVNQAHEFSSGIMHENESGSRRALSAKPRCTVKLIKLLELARPRTARSEEKKKEEIK